MNRRGQSETDLVVVIIVLFIIALLAVVSVKLMGGINTGLQAQSGVIGASAATASSNANSGLASGFDQGMVIALGLLYIGLFISSRNIAVEPMWFFLNIFLLLIALTLAAIFGNAFDKATNNAQFVTERAAMPAMTFVAGHLLEFSIGALAIILIGLFAKPGGVTESG
jgi:hypothetical protein